MCVPKTAPGCRSSSSLWFITILTLRKHEVFITLRMLEYHAHWALRLLVQKDVDAAGSENSLLSSHHLGNRCRCFRHRPFCQLPSVQVHRAGVMKWRFIRVKLILRSEISDYLKIVFTNYLHDVTGISWFSSGNWVFFELDYYVTHNDMSQCVSGNRAMDEVLDPP